jgi:hypothetical protein
MHIAHHLSEEVSRWVRQKLSPLSRRESYVPRLPAVNSSSTNSPRRSDCIRRTWGKYFAAVVPSIRTWQRESVRRS